MELDPDFSEFIGCCVGREVRFPVVGGFRFSLVGAASVGLGRRIVVRISGGGAPGLVEVDFIEPGVVVQLGHAPKRIDLLTSIDGVIFDDCWPARIEIEIGGLAVPFIDAEHLVANKRASGRLQDLADIEALSGDAPA